jgi:hypothetical protein
MDYKEKSKYAEPDGPTYTNPKTGEIILLRADQEVPEGFVKKGGRRRPMTRKQKKRRSTLKLRKVR